MNNEQWTMACMAAFCRLPKQNLSPDVEVDQGYLVPRVYTIIVFLIPNL